MGNIAVVSSISVFQRYVRMNDFHMIHKDWAVNKEGEVYYCVDIPQKAHGRDWNGKMIPVYNEYYKKIYDEIIIYKK